MYKAHPILHSYTCKRRDHETYFEIIPAKYWTPDKTTGQRQTDRGKTQHKEINRKIWMWSGHSGRRINGVVHCTADHTVSDKNIPAAIRPWLNIWKTPPLRPGTVAVKFRPTIILCVKEMVSHILVTSFDARLPALRIIHRQYKVQSMAPDIVRSPHLPH